VWARLQTFSTRAKHILVKHISKLLQTYHKNSVAEVLHISASGGVSCREDVESSESAGCNSITALDWEGSVVAVAFGGVGIFCMCWS
jgi:hypothetical protein